MALSLLGYFCWIFEKPILYSHILYQNHKYRTPEILAGKEQFYLRPLLANLSEVPLRDYNVPPLFVRIFAKCFEVLRSGSAFTGLCTVHYLDCG